MLCYVVPTSFKPSNTEEHSAEINELNSEECSVKKEFRYAELFTKSTRKKIKK
jgi:hypothetical protein